MRRSDVTRPKNAYLAWPNKKDLSMQETADLIEITVPKVGLHEIVILQS